MAKIQVNLEELLERLQNAVEDSYNTVEITIEESGYYNTLAIYGVGVCEEDSQSYGEIDEADASFSA